MYCWFEWNFGISEKFFDAIDGFKYLNTWKS